MDSRFFDYSLKDVQKQVNQSGFVGREKSMLALHINRIVQKEGNAAAIRELKTIRKLLPNGAYSTMPKAEWMARLFTP